MRVFSLERFQCCSRQHHPHQLSHHLFIFTLFIIFSPKLVSFSNYSISARPNSKKSTYQSFDDARPVLIIFCHNRWLGWPSCKSIDSAEGIVRVVVVVGTDWDANEKNWLWIEMRINMNKSMRRMSYYNINQDWLCVSPEMNHSSVSLTLVVHLTLIDINLKRYINIFVCVCVRLCAIIEGK